MILVCPLPKINHYQNYGYYGNAYINVHIAKRKEEEEEEEEKEKCVAIAVTRHVFFSFLCLFQSLYFSLIFHSKYLYLWEHGGQC